jgi:hypothetical protein
VNVEELDKAKIIEILKIQQAKRKYVITPISILKNLGFPIIEHSFFIKNKSVLLNLKQILKELHQDGILIKRISKQDFLGTKEIGYDYMSEK